MSEKKQHEISRMSSLVHQLSEEHGCNLVADIGCGLGYLGQTLASVFKQDVLGFELRESNCQNIRQPYINSSSPNSMITKLLSVDSTPQCTKTLRQAFTEHCVLKSNSAISNSSDISNDSAKFTNTAQQMSSDSDSENCRVCLVGLHCCGDLTPSTLQQFSSIDECKVVVCMSCCYHRLSTDGTSFQHFPMSSKLKKDYSRLAERYGTSINSLALRLACQETKSRWVRSNIL